MHKMTMVMAGLAVAALSGEVYAAGDNAAQAETEAPARDWNAGVELGWGGFGVFGLGGGGVSTAGVGVERHLAGPLWLRARGGAFFWRSTLDDTRQNAGGGYGALGVRVSFLEAGPLEASVFGEAQVSGARFHLVSGDVDVDNQSLGVSGIAGLAAEVGINEVLALRSEVGLLQASWSRTRWEDDTGRQQDTSTVGFDLVPSLQFRLRI